MANFVGTSGSDSFTGTSGDDTFDLHQGGSDAASGLEGDDIFTMGAKLDALDTLDGGDGSDTVLLTGNYYKAHAVTFSATTLTNIEKLIVGAGFKYQLTSDDGTVAGRHTHNVEYSAMTSINKFSIDRSAVN
jgi:hypothetical protein